MITILVAHEVAPGDLVELEADEQHHLRVRRAGDGEPLRLRDGRGLDGEGILRFEGKHARVEVERAVRRPAPAPLVLLVGAGDRERFAWLAEKAAELGVTALVPVVTTHAAAVATRLRAEQVAKLARRALEATKQSGACWVPEIAAPVALDAALAAAFAGRSWLADAGGAVPPARLDGGPVRVLVGPEGGLTGAERERAVGAGFDPIRLGPNVLRFETAALAAAVVVGAARTRGEGGDDG